MIHILKFLGWAWLSLILNEKGCEESTKGNVEQFFNRIEQVECNFTTGLFGICA